MRKILPILLFLFAFAARAEETTVWTNDLAAAKAKAEKEGKDILLFFSGSDWCSICKSLEKTLEKEDVKKAIVEKYIPVIIDYPRSFKLPDAIANQNKDLGFKFALSGVPMLIVMDTKGKAIGVLFGYDETIDLIKQFDAFKKVKDLRDAALAAANKLPAGPAKAKAYSDLFTALVGGGVFQNWSNYGYDEEIADIIKNDADNKAGVKICWDFRNHVITSRNMTLNKDYAGAMKPLQDFIAAYPEDKMYRQHALYALAQLKALTQDIAGCMLTLEETIAADPKSEVGTEAAAALAIIKQELAGQSGPQEEKK